jgi:transcription initiation factor TFIIE subunit alpha
VKLTARAFYDDVSMKGDNQPKTSRGDNRGMAVVVLDALTRYRNLYQELVKPGEIYMRILTL